MMLTLRATGSHLHGGGSRIEIASSSRNARPGGRPSGGPRNDTDACIYADSARPSRAAEFRCQSPAGQPNSAAGGLGQIPSKALIYGLFLMLEGRLSGAETDFLPDG